MNDEALAYVFSPPEYAVLTRSNNDTFAVTRSANDAFTFTRSTNSIIKAFTSSEDCRATLQREYTVDSVIVSNKVGVITPINLAAALCADAPERDVYLMDDYPTASLASRARAAGIRGILSSTQARQLLDIGQGKAANEPAIPSTASDSALLSATIGPTFHSAVRLPAVPPVSALANLPAVLPEATSANIPTIPPAATLANIPAVAPAAPLAERNGQGRIVGFFSGRGGVGKSTIALMTAFMAQDRGSRVALVDLDLQFGDIEYLAGREPSSRIQRLSLEQSCKDAFPVQLEDEALTLVVPPKHPEKGEEYASAIPSLLFGLAAQRELVVINTGSFWTDIHAHMVQCCDHLVFLMDQRATSIEACKQVVDLCVRLQAPRARFIYLLNGCGRHATFSTQDVMLALGGVEVLGLADGGSLVDELLALGCPRELLVSGNALVASLEALLNSLLGKRGMAGVDGAFMECQRDKARIFDLSKLRNLLGGAHRVAT